jgi:4-amino-4-deoxy-L-arabinose transferase-like glycosyltransferase
MTSQDAPRADRRSRIRPEWWGWIVPTAVFLAVAGLWLVLDSSVLNYDSARHFANTLAMRHGIDSGDLLAPITYDNINSYPPLLYLVGMLGTAVFGLFDVGGAVFAQAVVFGTLLAVGCWGTARIAYGNLAGALAAVIALGAPMIVSLFHVYMLDGAQAGAVAAAVWLVLASGRFERMGISALAGVAASAAMLIKPTSAIFLGGFLVAVLARGGWRHPRGLAAFLLVGVVLCAPWYIEHLTMVRGLTNGAAGPGSGALATGATYVTPPRWSVTNFAWYGWNLLNVQLLAPLFVAFVAGTVVAIRRFARDRSPADPTPELVIGGLVAYLGCTYLSLKDARYTLPAMVFVAVLATGWVPSLRGRARAVAAGVVTCAAAITFFGTSFGIGSVVAIKAPGAPANTLLGERSVHLYQPSGYLASAPRDDSAVERLMRAVRASGITTMELDPGGDATWNTNGLSLLMGEAGLKRPPAYDPAHLAPDTVFLTRHIPGPGLPRPCGRISGGYGLYLIKGGNAAVPFEQYRTWCPRDFPTGGD